MRHTLPVLLLLAAPAFAGDEPAVLDPGNFKVGQVGRFEPKSPEFRFRVVQVTDNALLVACPVAPVGYLGPKDLRDIPLFVVKGVRTKSRLGKGSLIQLGGTFKVREQIRLRDDRLAFVVELQR